MGYRESYKIEIKCLYDDYKYWDIRHEILKLFPHLNNELEASDDIIFGFVYEIKLQKLSIQYPEAIFTLRTEVHDVEDMDGYLSNEFHYRDIFCGNCYKST